MLCVNTLPTLLEPFEPTPQLSSERPAQPTRSQEVKTHAVDKPGLMRPGILSADIPEDSVGKSHTLYCVN